MGKEGKVGLDLLLGAEKPSSCFEGSISLQLPTSCAFISAKSFLKQASSSSWANAAELKEGRIHVVWRDVNDVGH